MRIQRVILAVLTMALVSGVSVVHSAIPTSGAVAFSASSNLKGAGPSKFIIIANGVAGSAKTLTSQNGMEYRISPDGKYVAFGDGSSVYVCQLKENAASHKVTSGAHPYWVNKSDGLYLFFSSQSGKVSFGTGQSYLQKIDLSTYALVGTRKEIKYNGRSSIMKGGMGTNGLYACTGYPDCTIAEADGTKVTSCGSGQKCNPSISPTLARMMILDDTGHQTFAIYDINGNVVKKWKPGGYVQNPEWSTHEDWCSWVQGDASGNNVMVGKIGESGTKIYSGAATFPHLYVGTVAASQPALSVTPSQVEFSFTIGQSTPAAQSVNVSISSGTVQGLAVSETAGWLTTSISGTTILNTVNPTGLSEGTQTATVTVKATGAENAIYTARLRVTNIPVFTSVQITPSTDSVAPGGTLQLTAKAKDQNGNDMASQPTFSWSLTGVGSVNNSGLFSAGTVQGKATVSAAGNGKTGTAVITVISGSAPVKEIEVLAPTAGQSYSVGGIMHIKWRTDERIKTEGVQVMLSVDEGKNWIDISPDDQAVDGTSAHWGDFAWTIPPNLTNASGATVSTVSGTCLIKVIEYSNTPNDVSGKFSIVGGATVSMAQFAAHARGVRTSIDAQGTLTVNLGFGGTHQLRLIASDGRTAETRSGVDASAYSFSNLASGMYFITITGATIRQQHTVIVNR